MKVAYPISHKFESLAPSLLAIKIARHSPCTKCTDCPGLHPHLGVRVVPDEQSESGLHTLEQYGSDDEDEDISSYLQDCECGHGVPDHGADESILGKAEFIRKSRVGIRLDELLQDSGRLLDFEYTDEDIISLRRQMGHHLSQVTISNSDSSPAQGSTTAQSVPQSPASSLLSDPPVQPLQPKKRRLSFSTSDEQNNEDEEEEEDEEEDRPLAARMPIGSRAAPKRSGKAPGKKSKKSHTIARGGEPATNGTNGHINGTTPQDVKMDDGQLNRLTAGVPVDSVGRSSTAPAVRAEKPSAIELRNGIIQITPVENDRQPRSLIILTGLKTLFQKQLPKMPREYIARLVYDHNSRGLAIIKRGYKVVGGICYRPFPQRGFAEIVFFATNSADQEKGYGGMLMDHFKAHVRKAYPDMWHFLTYADNYAVGYFEKQGFSKEIQLDRSVWAGYIKDYEGGTIMQCTMLPKVDYLNKAETFKIQQDAITEKIRQMSKSHVIYPGLPQFQPGMNQDVKVNPKDVPGLRETGWTPDLTKVGKPTTKTGLRAMFENMLSDLKTHPKAWAFKKPVDRETVHDYYDIIKHPMDFTTMESKLAANKYKTVEQFVDDVNLIFDNCMTYNPETTVYAKNARTMASYFAQLLTKNHIKLDDRD